MKPLRQFDLNLLLLLEALLTECHVSRAAERMFLSQSAMSHALNRLRQQLDDPLLVRVGNSLQPTPRAAALLPEIRQAILLIERSLSPPEPFQPEQSERTFTIACTDYFEAITLPPLMQQLQREAPGIKIEIDLIGANGSAAQLESGQIDLVAGLDRLLPVDPKLISRSWKNEPLACLIAENNSEVSKQLTLEQFTRYQHVLFTDQAGITSDQVDSWLESFQQQRRSIARTANYMAGARIVAVTDSIMTLPLEMAELFASILPVQLVKPPEGIPGIEMITLHHPLFDNDPALLWLLEILHQ